MNQRLFLATQVAMMLVIGVLAVVVVLTLRQNQRMQEQMLLRLSAMPGPTAATAPQGISNAALEWPDVRFRIVHAETGVPASGLRFYFSGEAYNAGQPKSFSGQTDSDGIAALGQVRPGGYALRVWSDNPRLYLDREIALPPGGPREPLVIEWPKLAAAPVTVSGNVPVRDPVDGVPWMIVMTATPSPIAAAGPGRWAATDLVLAVNHDNRMALLPRGTQWDPESYRNQSEDKEAASIDWKDTIEMDASMRYRFQRGALWIGGDSDPESSYEAVKHFQEVEPIVLSRESPQVVTIKSDISIADAVAERDRRSQRPARSVGRTPGG